MAKAAQPKKGQSQKPAQGKRKQAVAQQEQIDQLLADLQRARADYLNYQRRSESERAQIAQIVKEEVVLQLLPVVDDIKRALGHLPADLKNHEWAKGVVQTARQVDSALKRLDVEPIAAAGEEFDPSRHEAVNYEDGSGEREVVAAEVRTGYTLGGKVIRPSMVKVKKAPGAKGKQEAK